MKTQLPLNNNMGISLVETIVASTVSIVLGTVIYTIFFIYTNQSGESTTSFLMQQQYDNVAQQIARDVRKASFVLKADESPSSHGAGYDTVTSIVIWNAAGTAFAKYQINNGQLLEGLGGTAYNAGGGIVKLISGSSYFIVDPQRKRVRIHLTVCRVDRSATRNLAARKDVFLCRN